jgi:hypothetical protein
MEKPRPDITNSLQIQLGIRLTLDSVSYSNPLPDWFEVPAINYSAREEAIRRRIRMYLGGTKPEPPFAIALPRKSGETKPWSMPSVNDQIIFQTCVSSIAERLFEKSVDGQKVFSYRYNRNRDVLALTEDHLTAWRNFQNETQRRCGSANCILQIDLEDAFRSIDRARFIQFLRDLFPDRSEVDLLEILVNSFAAGEPGLPLVNDSVFFLGNAYLSVVDRAVGRHTSNFLRFVDDYRIFGKSQAELQNVAQALGPDLEHLGFRINSHKLRLQTGEEYLEALSQVRYAEKESDGALDGDSDVDIETVRQYSGPATYTGIIPPDIMVAHIKATLDHPEERLNDGRGRLLMASLRRARLDGQVVEDHSDGDNGIPALRRHFRGQLSRDRPMLERIGKLLNDYVTQPDELWRLTWLLYLVKDIDFEAADHRASLALQNSLAAIRTSRSVPTVARLWADAGTPSTRGEIERLHQLDYVRSGQLLVQAGRHA